VRALLNSTKITLICIKVPSTLSQETLRRLLNQRELVKYTPHPHRSFLSQPQ
jgi:hypothetical protein